jgi:Protein of unknown function (DUF1524)
MNRRLALALGGLGIAIVAGCQGLGPLDGGPTTPAGPAANGPVTKVGAADVATARTQLTRLSVAAGTDGGYNRTKDFGPAWSYDFDHNGCRSRDDVLARDLTRVRKRDRCAVVSGVLADPYTGATIAFDKAHAAAVQIDHVYPLAAAWAHGARGWPQQRRVAFANDPGNLIAASGSANESKGDSTPSEWQPQKGFRCAYAVRYISSATRYSLSITAADKRALTTMLGLCPK